MAAMMGETAAAEQVAAAASTAMVGADGIS
jgi:hypothetical protein